MDFLSLPDLAALTSLVLYALALVLCFLHLPRMAAILSWIAFIGAGVSGTLGAVPFVVFGLLMIWQALNAQWNLLRTLSFAAFMLLALFRVIPGIGGVVIQTAEAPFHPFAISWVSVIVAWLVYSGHTRYYRHYKQKRSWGTLLTVGMPVGLIAAAVSLSFQWTGPLDLPNSLGWLMIWALLDLLFISVSDESLYRGFVLGLMMQGLGNRKTAWLISLVVTSFLYALQHHLIWGEPFWGSLIVGGLFGGCFLLTGFLEAAIVAHFFRDVLLLLWGLFGAQILKTVPHQSL
jgi:membrane protease YdiL (CAAX protease family)